MELKLDKVYRMIFKEEAPADWTDSLKLLMINMYLESEIEIEKELERTRSEIWKTNVFKN